MKCVLILFLQVVLLFSFCACAHTSNQVPSAITTDSAFEEPSAKDDGVRVHAWISPSYVKNFGHDLVSDKGNLADFKAGFGDEDYAFAILKRAHTDGHITAYQVAKEICPYGHSSTLYKEGDSCLVRVDEISDGNRNYDFDQYSTPGVIYARPESGYDLLVGYTVPEDGRYHIRAAAQRAYGLMQSDGQSSTGSRFFLEHNGVVVAEETDLPKNQETKPVAFDETIELKKGDTIYFGYDPIDSKDERLSALNDDATIKYFYLEREGAEQVTTDATTKLALQMAKNEKESFQISVHSAVDVEGLGLRMTSQPVDGITVAYQEECVVPAYHVLVPDPLLPSEGLFNVEAGVTKTMLVRFDAATDVKAGSYTYVFELCSPSGWVLETFSVTLKVWDFALPEEYGCDTAFGINTAEIMSKEDITVGVLNNKMYKLYYDLLLEYKISADYLPYDILDSRADEYMSNPNVTSFRIDHTLSDDAIVAIYNKLQTNPVWLEKAYLYIYDEPVTVEALDAMAKEARRLHQLCPELDIVVPFFLNLQYDDSQDQIDFMAEYCDIFCAKSACWTPDWLSDPLNNGYFGDRMEEMKEEGKKIWWYVCWEPVYPYCNLQLNERGIQHRELFWQQYTYEVDGLLYWNTTYWLLTRDPWQDTATVKDLNEFCFGDGSLLYPGKATGKKGPVASLRLECIRDGVEDFDLLKLAEQYLGREFVEEQIRTVAPSLTEHSNDEALFARVRERIGDALEVAMNQ